MTILLLSADLMIVSQVDSAARKSGVQVRTLSSPAAAAEILQESAAQIVLIDLGLPAVDVPSLVPQLRSVRPSARFVAFGPHVHEAKLAAARDAGCDEVTSRGAFLAQLDSILKM